VLEGRDKERDKGGEREGRRARGGESKSVTTPL